MPVLLPLNHKNRINTRDLAATGAGYNYGNDNQGGNKNEPANIQPMAAKELWKARPPLQ
jgi:hypothetical protein